MKKIRSYSFIRPSNLSLSGISPSSIHVNYYDQLLKPAAFINNLIMKLTSVRVAMLASQISTSQPSFFPKLLFCFVSVMHLP